MPRNLADTTPEQAQIQLQAWADELDAVRAMTPPPEDADTLKRYVAVLQDRLDLVQLLFADALAGKPIRDAEGNGIGDINRRLVTEWAVLGALDCGGQARTSSMAPRRSSGPGRY